MGEVEPVRGSLDLEWGEVSYLEWRPPSPTSRPDVLLLHGGGLDSANLAFERLGRVIADAGHRVVAPDHPGYGHTPLPPWDLTQGNLVAYTGELIEALGLDDFVLGGFSMGGGMAIGHALDHPEGIRALVLLASYGCMDQAVDGPLGCLAHHTLRFGLHSGVVPISTRLAFRSRILMRAALSHIVATRQGRTRQLLEAVMPEAIEGSAWDAFMLWLSDEHLAGRLKTNYLERLGELQVPVLFVHGQRDRVIPVSSSRAAATKVRDVRLVTIPRSGHLMHRDRPQTLTSAVVEFLDEVSGDREPAGSA